jgi:cobyrinic acid a,c-diamide synthase
VTAVRQCPALLVSAPASGQGKTSVTAALARWHTKQGRRVRVFKTGPDFLDPMVLERAAGTPAYQLDLWMCGEADVRQRLFDAAGACDLILIEGVMGLFDGDPSSADLAQQFGVPVMTVIDGAAMAQTFGALACGMASYRKKLSMYGVAANRIGSDYHAQLLKSSLPASLHWLGALPRDEALALPERHLGLIAAVELDDIDARLDALANAWSEHASTSVPAPVRFAGQHIDPVPMQLHKQRIAIARDAAFCFIYQANLDLLSEAGAELRFFSPLAGDALPDCDAVWLPGGYPELHLPALSARRDLHKALREHRDANKPILAECGGLLFGLESLADRDGNEAQMAGLLSGRAVMQSRLAALGLQRLALPEGEIRGHTFHYARAWVDETPLTHALNPNGGPSQEAVYRDRRLTASFVHLYFPSNPLAAQRLFLP